MNSFGACGVYNGKENTKENTVPKKSTKIHEKIQKEIANCPSISPIHDGK